MFGFPNRCSALAPSNEPARPNPNSAGMAWNIDFQTTEIFGAYFDRVLALLKRHGLNIPVTHQAGIDYGRDGYAAAGDLHPFVSGGTTRADIPIVTSERSERVNPGDPTLFRPAGERADLSGAYKLFSELRYPFDLITAERLLERDFRGIEAIVVPYVRCLDPRLVEKVRQWVASGGTLVFGYRSAEWDNHAQPLERKYFGLVGLGADNPDQVTFIRPSAKFGLPDSYLRMHETALPECANEVRVLGTPTHPALKGADREWVTHNAIPGEDTSRPVSIAGTFGKGRFIYSGCRFFKESREQGIGAYRILIDRELRASYTPALSVRAPGAIDALCYQARGEIRVVLLNSGSDRPGGERNHVNIEEVVPVSVEIEVRQTISAAFDLHGNSMTVRRSGAMTVAHAPSVYAYAGVRLIGRQGRGRGDRASRKHGEVLRAPDVLWPDALRLRVLTSKRSMTLTTGASTTPDIAMTRIQGVHGPRRLDAIVMRS